MTKLKKLLFLSCLRKKEHKEKRETYFKSTYFYSFTISYIKIAFHI